MTEKFELDKHDLTLIHTALCYFDRCEGGNYDEWFGKDCEKVKESFHYLYSISKIPLPEPSTKTPSPPFHPLY